MPRVGSFRVAEVKPHFGCKSPEGRERVRQYVDGLRAEAFALIVLIQVEFVLPEPVGYTAFGASCVCSNVDPVVVLVDVSQFTLLRGLGETAVGSYAELPFVASGTKPSNGSMCAADCHAPGVGERGYAGAVLQHKSGVEICVVAGTLPHSYSEFFVPLSPRFLADVRQGCGDRELLFVLDTNAMPDNQTVESMGQNNGADWGPCDDPGVHGNLTCCNDTAKYGHEEPSFRYDRTAVCRGGSVESWEVERAYCCGANEEHRFTKATVRLAENGIRPYLLEMI